MTRKLFIVSAFFIGVLVWAQTSIYGTVTDTNALPIAGAEIYVEGTDYLYYTESDGTFSIEIPAGTYTFNVDAFGFEKLQETLSVQNGQSLEWSPMLEVQSQDGVVQELGQVLIQANTSKESEASVLKLQRNSSEIKEYKGAAELSRLGKGDASAAVATIVGVSKQTTTSDVYVRGLGDRYIHTSLNGLSLPSNDINKKNIDLDLFSSDLIQNISVSKTMNAGGNADFAAGSIDITSKEHSGRDYIDLSVGTRVNSNAVGKDMIQSEGTSYFGLYGRYNDNPFATVISQSLAPVDSKGLAPYSTNLSLNLGETIRFGEEAKLSLFASGSFANEFNYQEGNQQSYTSISTLAFPDVEKYQYNTVSTGMLSALMRFNDKQSLKFSSFLINNSSDEVGYYGYKGLGFKRDIADQGFFQSNVQFNQELIFINQLMGEHELTPKLNLDWGVGYNILNADEPDRKRLSISNYQNLLDNDASTFGTFVSTTNFDSQRYFQKIDEDEFNSRINFNFDVSDILKINLGGNTRYKKRDFESIRYGYEFLEKNIGSLDDIDAFFAIENWMENYNTFTLNPIEVTNPEDGSSVVSMSQYNMPGMPENTYDATLINLSTYVDFQWQLGENLLLIPGMRFEDVTQKINWDVNNLSSLFNPGKAESKSQIFLPSLNMKYAINEDSNFRVSGSQSVSFPEFKEFAPFVYEGITTRIGGNPDLLGTSDDKEYKNVKDVAYSKILNFDAKYELFFSRSEMISIAGFYKVINDPINLVVGTSATGDEYYFRTGDKATVLGAELDLKKDILNTDKTELFLGFNASYIKTNQDLYSEINGTRNVTFNRKEDKLQGASDFIAQADLNYRKKWGGFEPTFTLVGNYFSDRIYALGSGQIGNKVEKGIPTLDFLMSTEIGRNTSLKLGAKNLLNPAVEIFRETSGNDVVLESFKKGQIFSLEITYKF